VRQRSVKSRAHAIEEPLNKRQTALARFRHALAQRLRCFLCGTLVVPR
jgi:hypothetical protein